LDYCYLQVTSVLTKLKIRKAKHVFHPACSSPKRNGILNLGLITYYTSVQGRFTSAIRLNLSISI